MAQQSAGLLIFRCREGSLEVLLVHPGGPFWRKKDVGAWQIPKGLIEPDEEPLSAARREAEEELGIAIEGALRPLGALKQKGGKIVAAFAIECDLDAESIRSNMFEMEWPPRSGRVQSFPEVDAARWFTVEAARTMMLESQRPLLERLTGELAERKD